MFTFLRISPNISIFLSKCVIVTLVSCCMVMMVRFRIIDCTRAQENVMFLFFFNINIYFLDAIFVIMPF